MFTQNLNDPVADRFSAGLSTGGAAEISVAGTATAVPAHVIGREQVKAYVNRVFGLEGPRLEAMMAVIDNAGIKQRFSVFPIDEAIEPRPLTETTRQYQEHAVTLGRQVAHDCLAQARMRAEEIDLLITVSCTGFMIPSLDAHLINDLGFRSDVRRLPITELGCAGGAASVARAADFIKAYPLANVLIVAVELPSLSFQRGNLSQANLISSILFGDGAAAAVVTGRASSGPQILDWDSYLFPNSIEAMGFELRDNGFHIVLLKDVPEMIRDAIKGLITRFLGRNTLRREDIAAFVLHPGGQKLLSYIEEELDLCKCQTQPSWDVLTEYGNLSSASVIFVLHEWLKRQHFGPGQFDATANGEQRDGRQYGLMAAFGPGFSAEMLLLRWR